MDRAMETIGHRRKDMTENGKTANGGRKGKRTASETGRATQKKRPVTMSRKKELADGDRVKCQ